MEKNEKFIEESTGPCNWDELIMKRFLEFVPENCIVADIGANHGLFSLNVLKNTKVNKIYAIEPDVENFEILKNNLVPYYSSVDFINAAVSNKNGKIDIYEGNGDPATRNILGEKSFWNENSLKNIKRCTVDCATMDYIFLEKLKTKVDICKIDVEGAEVLVLEGGKKAIKDMRCLFVECHTEETYKKIVEMGLKKGWMIKFLKNLHTVKSLDDINFCYQIIVFPNHSKFYQ